MNVMLRTIICFLVLVAGYAEVLSSEELLDKLCGVWVNREFVADLRRTRSPKNSAEGIHDVYFVVERDAEFVNFQLSAWLYDGWGFAVKELKRTSDPGVYEPVLGNNDLKEKEYRFIFDAGKEPVNELSWTMWEEYRGRDGKSSRERITLNFERLNGDFMEFVNGTVIAGSYQDQHGKRYRFNKDGTADCEGKKFEYGEFVMGYSAEFQEGDIIRVLGSIYKFQWDNGKFYLYKDISKESDQWSVFNTEPDIVLTPLN